MSAFQIMTPPQSHNAYPSKSQFSSTTSPISPWQPLTPPFTTNDLALAKYTRFARLLQSLRIGLAAVTLIASITITACAAIALHTYRSSLHSHDDKAWLLPVWPQAMDLRDTRAMIAVGSILAVSSLTYLALSLVNMKPKSRNPLIPHHLLSTLLLLTINLPLTLFATIFVARVNTVYTTSHSTGTLGSWTCKWRNSAANAAPNTPATSTPRSTNAPDGFDRICDHVSAAFDLVVLLCVIVGVEIFVVVGGWVVGWKARKAEKGRAVSKVELVEGRI